MEIIAFLAPPVFTLIGVGLTLWLTGKREAERLDREDERSREERVRDDRTTNTELRRKVYAQFLTAAWDLGMDIARLQAAGKEPTPPQEHLLAFFGAAGEISLIGGEDVRSAHRAISVSMDAVLAGKDSTAGAELGKTLARFAAEARKELGIAEQ